MWRNIQIQSNCIEKVVGTAALINLPKNSSYKGYSFWYPCKLCRQIGKNGWLLQISFKEDFTFKLKKYGKGQYNWGEVIKETEIDASELMSAFGFGSEARYEDLSDLRDED